MTLHPMLTQDLATLTRVEQERARLDERIRLMVKTLRAADVPWSAIGDALGVTKQAAQQRYGPV